MNLALGAMTMLISYTALSGQTAAPSQDAYLKSREYQASLGKLKFRKDSTFHIVQFTDIHWNNSRPDLMLPVRKCMECVLDAEHPDLVILTGDIFTGTPNRAVVDSVLAPIIGRKLQWAVTFGNHDDEQDMTREQLYEYLSTLPGNLTSTVKGISGVTNYILPVTGNGSDRIASAIYVFDSHAYSAAEATKGYDWIKRDQIRWYESCSRSLTQANGGKPLPALAFFHIPLPEYNYAAQDEKSLLIGTRKEKSCAPVVNSGLFTALLDVGDVMATFVGHDHVNDYLTLYKGIVLGYGRFTGGNTTYHDIPGGNGARVIILKEGKRDFRTYVRLRSGKVKDDLRLVGDLIMP